MTIDSINNTANRLKAEGYNVSACSLRAWVRDGSMPASMVGSKSLLYYPVVVAHIKLGRAVTAEEALEQEVG